MIFGSIQSCIASPRQSWCIAARSLRSAVLYDRPTLRTILRLKAIAECRPVVRERDHGAAGREGISAAKPTTLDTVEPCAGVLEADQPLLDQAKNIRCRTGTAHMDGKHSLVRRLPLSYNGA
jgi:hypothetical protein